MSNLRSPWSLSGAFIVNDDGDALATIKLHGSQDHPRNPNWKIDALTDEDRQVGLLIAAAPDLYEALKLFASPSMSESRPSRGESSIGWQRDDGLLASQRVKIAKAALAKATGPTSGGGAE